MLSSISCVSVCSMLQLAVTPTVYGLDTLAFTLAVRHLFTLTLLILEDFFRNEAKNYSTS